MGVQWALSSAGRAASVCTASPMLNVSTRTRIRKSCLCSIVRLRQLLARGLVVRAPFFVVTRRLVTQVIRVVSRLLSSLFFSENMLSFTRRSKCFVDGKHTVPSEQLRGGRPTCAVSTPARVAIPESSARRERHLLSLAVEFLCRWHVAMPADMPYGNEETEVAAFYAAIADLDADQRRRLMLDAGAVLASADAPQHLSPKDLEEYDLIALRNECCSPLLHDWRCDTVQIGRASCRERV